MVVMAGILKKLFRGKKPAKDQLQIDREMEGRESKRGNRKVTRFERNFETSSTAAYHTDAQPRPYRATRSYAGGEVSDDDERFGYFNKSFELRKRDETLPRSRGFSKKGRRRYNNTSEYGSGDPSPTNLMYDPTLDDSESDYLTMEREKRIYELEKKLQEDREKLKGYRERFKVERDLRASTEKEIMALKDALRKKKKKDEVDRKCLVSLINKLQQKVHTLEQQQRFAGMGILNPPLLECVVGAGESLCTMSASSVPVPSGFSQSTIHNNSDEIDETKNFRRSDAYDTELPRSSNSSSSVTTGEVREVTMLQDDVFSGIASVVQTISNRRVHSDSELSRPGNHFNPSSL